MYTVSLGEVQHDPAPPLTTSNQPTALLQRHHERPPLMIRRRVILQRAQPAPEQPLHPLTLFHLLSTHHLTTLNLIVEASQACLEDFYFLRLSTAACPFCYFSLVGDVIAKLQAGNSHGDAAQ